MPKSTIRSVKPAGKGAWFLYDGDNVVARVASDFNTCHSHWVRAGLGLDKLQEIFGNNFHTVEALPECCNRRVKPAGKGTWFLYSGDDLVASMASDFNTCHSHWVRARLGLDKLREVFGSDKVVAV